VLAVPVGLQRQDRHVPRRERVHAAHHARRGRAAHGRLLPRARGLAPPRPAGRTGRGVAN
jgi:hypothetical protein